MEMQKMSDHHRLLSLTAINDLIVEMSYVQKIKNLTVNRRISLSFRDSALYQVMRMAVELSQSFTQQIITQQSMSSMSLYNGQGNTLGQGQNGFPGNDGDLLCESLLLSLTIFEKSLSYDFTAVLLNESLDEP
jgi:hypothetical protein